MNVIEIDRLTRDFSRGFVGRGRIRALDGLSLEVGQGEVFGFLGPNGAGKTTTFRILVGLVAPTSGSARILGRPTGDIGILSEVGYLAEQPRFHDHLTAREFLVYCGRLSGLLPADAESGAGRMLERFGLTEAADRPLRNLSKGMLQRVGLAQALIHDPRILLLDEPMSGLDPIGRSEVRDLIVSLRDEGKTVFFSSHILSDIEAMCDRVAIIDRGRLVESGRLEEILADGGGRLEALISGVGEAALTELRAAGLTVDPTPSGVRVVLPNDRSIEMLVRIVGRHTGRIVSINPLRESLEDRFLRSIGERHR